MKVKLIRKPYNIEEVDRWINKYPSRDVKIEKVIVMDNKEWNLFISDFYEPQEFLPGVVQVINKENHISLIVDSQGYNYSRYVGRKVIV
tara:strand:+ start:172 stop:438 length:267 start_codon:yes stop_codon:yes gene_type:complete